MTDLILFGVSGILIFSLLYCRFRYFKSLTGVGSGGAVDPSYWGAYTGAAAGSDLKIALPKTPGLCPRCGNKAGVGRPCVEH